MMIVVISVFLIYVFLISSVAGVYNLLSLIFIFFKPNDEDMEKYFFLPYWLKWICFPVTVLLLGLVVYIKIQLEQSDFCVGGFEIQEEWLYYMLLFVLLVFFFTKEKSNNQLMSQLKAKAMIMAVGINYLFVGVGLLLLNSNYWNAIYLLLYNTFSLFLLWLLIFYLKKSFCKEQLND